MVRQTFSVWESSLKGILVFAMGLRLAAIPALILSALVLGVFWALRDFGPESALRRFHMASVNRDEAMLGDVTDFSPNPQYAQALSSRVQDLARAGGRYELRRMDRSRTRVVAEVVYRFPFTGQQIPSLWVVEKTQGRWRVNPYRTMTLMERAFRQ
jgi:hypothetical protein